MRYTGTCTCKKIEVVATFPRAIETYEARACDCDFCVARNLAYLSDANGTLSFSPRSGLQPLTQGSGQAVFWQCTSCHDVVAVTHEQDGQTRGAAAKSVFSDEHPLRPSVTVSPKTLSPQEKPQRWQQVWSRVV